VAGITHAVGVQALGPGLNRIFTTPTGTTTPPNTGAFCTIEPKDPTASGINVEMWSSKVFAQQVKTFTHGLVVEQPARLGRGAVYAHPRAARRDEGTALFRAGRFTVLLSPSVLGSQDSGFPVRARWLALARAVRHHLG
jgi:hypothetical protein